MIPKFRAWDKNAGTMYYTDNTHMFEFFDTGWHLICLDELGPRIVCGQVERGRDDGVLMQSSGLTDRVGTEIFSADIVSLSDGFKTEVRFIGGAFLLDGSRLGMGNPNLSDIVEQPLARLEAIGNSLEAPELLEFSR